MDPTILSKIQAFAARRRRLIILRGICAAVAMLLATMMVVALLDRFFLLPDWLRWTLSGTAYLAVIIVEWRACLRLLWADLSPRRLARLVERTAPQLREDLLSAVELGEEPEHYDSRQFRELVQDDVAERISRLDEERLLPTQLVRRSIIMVSALLVVLVAALIFTRFQFGTMLLRALLPGANLPHISSVQIAIIEPHPAEMAVPQGDSIPLLIETGGRPVAQAYLETFTKNGGRNLVQMIPSGRNRFNAQIQIAREDVQYRVRAGDAFTVKYRLTAAARPHVVRFQKTFHYPAYSQLPERKVTEDTGDLVALEGTEVDLLLETDQPVRAAELRVETGKQTATFPAEAAGQNQLKARLPLSASGTYRVHLVAQGSNFENKFSPEYELRAEPDLIPKVELETPDRDIVATTNELLDLTGNASDDLAISGIEQLYRVNEGPWKSRKMPLGQPLPAARVESQWDLSQESFRPGDIVTTKLVATDRKGLRGESKPIQLTIAAGGFDSHRAAALLEKQRLLATISALRGVSETLEKRVNDIRTFADNANPDEAHLKQASGVLATSLDDYEQRAGAAITQLSTAIHAADPGHDSGHLVLIGRALSRLQASGATIRMLHQQTFSAVSEPVSRRELMREAQETARWILPRVRQTEESCRVYVTGEEIDIALENLQVAFQEQRQLVDQTAKLGDKAAWPRVATRCKAILAEAAQVEETFKTSMAHAPGGVSDRLRREQKRLSDIREKMQKVLEPEPTNAIWGHVQGLANTLTDALNATFDLKRSFMQPPVQSYNQLRGEMQPSWAAFAKLRTELDSLLRNEKVPVPLRQRLALHRWDTKADTWKTFGDWEEARPDSDTYFVQDLRSLALTLATLRAESTVPVPPKEREPVQKKINTIDYAFRTLESAHDLSEVVAGLDQLAAAEKWEAGTLRARTSDTGDWQWLQERLRQLPGELARTGPNDNETRQIFQKVQVVVSQAVNEPPAHAVANEMNQRFNRERAPVPAADDTRRVADRVREALELLRPAIAKARQTLAEITPKLAERMEQLAREAAALQERAKKQAEAPQPSPDAAREEAQDQLAAQQRLNQDLKTVTDAIRSDAQRQDLMKKDGRERARDADDALAMLKEPPTQAEKALSEAAKNEKAEEQKAALNKAATEQQKLAQALEQIAKHYDALEKGDPTDSRLALREQEKKLGVKEQLDSQYEMAEKLAEASEGTPEEMIKKLEQALPKNPLMRQELSSVSKNILKSATEKLSDASKQEQQVNESVKKLASEQRPAPSPQAQQPQPGQNPSNPQTQPNQPQAPTTAQNQPQNQGQPQQPQNPQAQPNAQANAANPSQPQPQQPNAQTPPKPAANQPSHPMLAQAATQQAPIAKSAATAGEELERAGRHEDRLNNKMAGRELMEIAQQVQQTAAEDVPKAREALAAAQAAQEAQPAVAKANENLQRNLAQIDAAATRAPDRSAVTPMAPTPDALPENAQQPATTPGETGTKPAAGEAKPSGQAKPAAAGEPQSQPQMASQPGSQSPGMPSQNMAAAKPSASGQQKPGDPTASYHAMTMDPAEPIDFTSLPPPTSTASPQQQVWMARALDSLDAAVHMKSENQEGSEQGQSSQQQQGKPGEQGKDGQQANASNQAMSQAQQAMSAAAQAQAAAMRSGRTPPPNGEKPSTAKGGLQADSKTGAQTNANSDKYGAIPNALPKANGDWGKLPKQMAEQLSQGQRETTSSEYRSQVETYYRVIAERAKKP